MHSYAFVRSEMFLFSTTVKAYYMDDKRKIYSLETTTTNRALLQIKSSQSHEKLISTTLIQLQYSNLGSILFFCHYFGKNSAFSVGKY